MIFSLVLQAWFEIKFPKMDLHINIAILIYAYFILFLLLQEKITTIYFTVIGKQDYFSLHTQFLFK